MSTQLPLPISTPDSHSESIAHEIAVAQCNLRTMTPQEIMSFVGEVQSIFAQLDTGHYSLSQIQFAKNILLGQSKLRPMNSAEIVTFLQGLLGDGIQPAPVQFMFVPPAPQIREITREEALASLTADPSHIVCLICKEKMKMLTKAHMKKHGITMDEYRRRFNFLGSDALVCKELINLRSETLQLQRKGLRDSKASLAAKQKAKNSTSDSLPAPFECTREEALASLNGDPDHVVCLVCGEKRKSLTKTHMQQHGITMEEYRERYNFLSTDSFLSQNTQKLRAQNAQLPGNVFYPPAPIVREYTREEALTSLTANPDHVVCLICGEEMKVITPSHMKKHGITMEEYRRRFNFLSTDPLVSLNSLKGRSDNMKKSKGWLSSPTYLISQTRKKHTQDQPPLQSSGTNEDENKDIRIRKNEKSAIE